MKLYSALWTEELSLSGSQGIKQELDQALHTWPKEEKKEKIFFHLGRYHNKLLDLEERGMDESAPKFTESYRMNLKNTISYFSSSLLEGTEHIYHSMPKILTLWIAFGEKVENSRSKDDAAQSLLSQLNETMKNNAQSLPSYQVIFSSFSLS